MLKNKNREGVDLDRVLELADQRKKAAGEISELNRRRGLAQEARDADLLLHVVDASNPDHPEQITEVMRVLREIGADDLPQILVFNKLDAVEPERQPLQRIDQIELDGQTVPRIFLSAHTGDGLSDLRGLLAERVRARFGARQPESPESGDGLEDSAQ